MLLVSNCVDDRKIYQLDAVSISLIEICQHHNEGSLKPSCKV